MIELFTTKDKEIERNVRVILETYKYSCPLCRDLGLNALFLDEPTEKAKSLMRAEIMSQIEKFEPRAQVLAISFETDHAEGIVKPIVTLR